MFRATLRSTGCDPGKRGITRVGFDQNTLVTAGVVDVGGIEDGVGADLTLDRSSVAVNVRPPMTGQPDGPPPICLMN